MILKSRLDARLSTLSRTVQDEDCLRFGEDAVLGVGKVESSSRTAEIWYVYASGVKYPYRSRAGVKAPSQQVPYQREGK